MIINRGSYSFVFDDSARDRLSGRWFELMKGYLYAVQKSGGKRVRTPVANLVLNVPTGLMVDHIDRDPRNNRACNLRVVSQSQNQRNRTNRLKKERVGVSYDKYHSKWDVSFRYTENGARRRLRRKFVTYDEAVAFRETVEQKHGITWVKDACGNLLYASSVG